MFNSKKAKVLAVVGSAVAMTQGAFAVPLTVDLADAQGSLANAGTAMIAIAVSILGTILVIKFLKRG